MKKIISLLLAAIMLLSLLAGCGGSKAILSSTEELPEGEYQVVDDGDVVATIISTGKKITVLNEDEDELLEETKFKYDSKAEMFTIDGEKAFSLSIDKKTVTITIPKNSPLGIKKGDYELTAADAKGSKDSKKDSKDSNEPALEKGWYALLDGEEEVVGYLNCTGKKIAAYDDNGCELMEEAKFAYDDDEGAFMIDGKAAFSLTVEKKTTTITIPKKSPLGLDKGEYTLEECDEDDVPTSGNSSNATGSTAAAGEAGSEDFVFYDMVKTSSGHVVSIGLPADIARDYPGIADGYSYLTHFSDDYSTYSSVYIYTSSSYGTDVSYIKESAADCIYLADDYNIISKSDVITFKADGVTLYGVSAVYQYQGSYYANVGALADDGSSYYALDFEFYCDNQKDAEKMVETFRSMVCSITVK